jgi:hypothetical protein
VDGFDQDECARQCDEGTIISCCLLATQGDALESFELADSLFDTGTSFVEDLRKECGNIFGVGSIRDYRTYSSLACRLAI